jgi:hypothetical protein
MKYDAELLETDLLNLVQSNLPAKIAEITAEKADSIVVDVPLNEQYLNSTDDQVDNFTLTVIYGLTDGEPFSISSGTAENNRYMFLIYIDELNEQPGVVRKKLFRYIRALKEIFEENFDRLPCVSKLDLQTVAPTSASWDKNERSPVYKVGGVYISTSIAS